MENQRVLRELPPRHLDWYTQAVLLLGDFVSQTGWALLAIGSVFFWTTAVNSEVKYFFQDQRLDWMEKAGVILEADSTASVEDGQRIWKYRHSVAPGDGYRYTGTSFSVGKKFDVGQIAFIRYDAANPLTNYVIGLRRGEHSWRVNLLLLLPLLGLLFVFYPARQNFRFLRLLKIGDFTRGVMETKAPTGQSVKSGAQVLPVFRFDFRFAHNDGAYFATCRTHHPSLVEDEATESILFDRYRPANHLVYDAVPNAPKIGRAGKLEPVPPQQSWVLFLPGFVVAVNGVFLLMK